MMGSGTPRTVRLFYTSMSRVELQSTRIRREASAVLNPLLAPRSTSLRLSQ